jgi:hypothetical protein
MFFSVKRKVASFMIFQPNHLKLYVFSKQALLQAYGRRNARVVEDSSLLSQALYAQPRN